MRLVEGDAITGRTVSCTDESVRLDVNGTAQDVPFADVERALIQVELNRPKATRSEDEEG